MAATPLRRGTQRGPSPILLSPARTMLLALALGLCGGYLDLIVMTVMKYCWNDLRYFWSGSDFPWSVPVAHAFLLGVAGALVAVVNRVGPRWLITLRTAAWLFATLAIWWGLLRVPLCGACTLVLAAGLARPISAAVTALSRRRVQYAWTAPLGLLVVLAAFSTELRSVRNYRAMAVLPAPAQGARNIVLIVWDTQRKMEVQTFRRLLLDTLSDNPGSVEMEKAYLKP
jgi:hypothetical protein